MSVSRLSRVRGLFEAALELQPETRDDFLGQACLGDHDLLRQVQQLLAGHTQTGGVLDLLSDTESAPLDFFGVGRMEGRRIGPYLVGPELGHGGMGVVYAATRADGAFHKKFAFKVVRSSLASKELADRFQQEREILGRLDHPNIAHLVDAGTTEEELPYYVMDFVDGQPIDDYCIERRLNVSERIRLFRKVCVAVQYAHQNLIVHRDLKPSNILVTPDGTVKLLDFGIAKLLDPKWENQALAATMTGVRLMTPEYASPEQIKRQAITTSTDVYALGVILYELLTGHKPYDLKNRLLHEIERAICEEEPTRPSTAVSEGDESVDESWVWPEGTVPRMKRRLVGDIDTILLKALQKEPVRRYSSAEQLDADLGRHLDGMPISAHDDSQWYRGYKFALRHRAWMTTGAAVFLLFTTATLITLHLYLEASRAQHLAVRESQIADSQRTRAEQEANRAEAERNLARLQTKAAQREKLRADSEAAEATEQRRVAEAKELSAWASKSLNDDPELSSILAIHAWAKQHALFPALEQTMHDILMLPDSAQAFGGLSPMSPRVSWSPDGSQLATITSDNVAAIVNVRDGRVSVRLPSIRSKDEKRFDLVTDVAWSPRRDRIVAVTASGSMQICETESLKCTVIPEGPWFDVAWSPDGDQVAGLIRASNYSDRSRDPSATGIWDAETGRQVLKVEGHHPVWSRDGQRLATGALQSTKIWDVSTGRLLLSLDCQEVGDMAWSPDGRYLAVPSRDNVVYVWDLATGSRTLALVGHQDVVETVDWSPDGSRLATAGRDRVARLWDVHNGHQLAVLRGHQGEVRRMRWSPDGNFIATASSDGTIKLWLNRPNTLPFSADIGASVSGGSVIAWSPNSESLGFNSADAVKIVDVQTGKEKMIVHHPHDGFMSSLAWSPDGSQFATGGMDGKINIWKTLSGQKIASLHHPGKIEAISWTVKGNKIATASKFGIIRKEDRVVMTSEAKTMVWDACTAQRLYEVDNAESPLAWNPDGTTLATTTPRRGVSIREGRTGREMQAITVFGINVVIYDLAWSPNGRRLAISASNSTTSSFIKIVDVRTGVESPLSGRWHASGLTAVPHLSWSSDGRRLAAISPHGQLVIIDAESGQELFELRTAQADWFQVVKWSPDGRKLAAVSSAAVGIYPVQQIDLLRLVRAHVHRTLTNTECSELLNTSICPPMPNIQ